MNGSSCSSPLNPTADKIGKTFAYCLIFVVSLVGNSIIRIVVYKTETLRKPINYFIVNMAMSDLLYAIFFIPWNVTELLMDSWLVGGPLGQSLCKLLPFSAATSVLVSVQSLVLISVDRFGAMAFPLRSPSSVQRCVPSSFSPRGSSRLLTSLRTYSSSNLLNTQGNGRASFYGMKPLESPRPSLVTM